jgi:hypothetical protein
LSREPGGRAVEAGTSGDTIPTLTLKQRCFAAALPLLVLSLGCATRIPAQLACPEFPEPVMELGSDAVPPALACAAAAEPAAYLESWKAQLLANWKPPDTKGGTGITAAIFTMSHSGSVARFCIDEETRPRMRPSVVSALDTFEPDAPPSEVVAACLAGKRFRARFQLVLE